MRNIDPAIYTRLSITGRAAMAASQLDLALGGFRLCKAADPLDEPEEDISLDRAEQVLAEDPQLVVLEAAISFHGNDRGEVLARVGQLQALVRGPLIREGERWLPAERSEALPEGFEILALASIEQELEALQAAASAAFSAWLGDELDGG